VISVKIARLALFALLIGSVTHTARAADATLWDSSGNGLLSGTYNFREVMWRNNADLRRVAIYGSMVFDGNGRYTLTSSVIDSSVGSVQSFSTTGAYRISASGMGFMDDPIRLSAGSASSTVWGLVSRNIFIGSSTDDHINNLFIAAPAPSQAPTNASFNGSYWAAAVNFPSSSETDARDMLFPLSPNGQGGLGTLNVTGLTGAGTSTVNQTVNGAVYSFANGALTLGFGGSPSTQTLIAGNALCYLSPDAGFFFGGSATGFDMIVGVRAMAGAVAPDALNGIFYQAGADVTPSGGIKTLNSYYGSFSVGSGVTIGHQRLLTAFDPSHTYEPYDYTYSDSVVLASDGTHDDFLGFHYVPGAGGAIQIGFGNGAHLGINIAVKAPDFAGPGVYLNPAGIANAASSAPFTVGVSRGGFIALYGTNLSANTVQSDSVPFMLGQVQVRINGRFAPIYYVRSDVVLAIVPFATTGTVASIQVINNGVASDIRTVRVKDSTPGIYTNPPGGVALAIGQHVRNNSYATITEQDPALPGETIVLYVNGLGDVNPPVADGVPASLVTLSPAVTQPLILIDNEPATVGFAGLSPGLTGVYAITVTIPPDIGPGDVFIDISLPDAYTTEAQIPIGTSSLAKQPAANSELLRAPPRDRPALPSGALRRFPNRK
jgi:uncharacterized protein (TIGR03437 family)